MRHHVETAIVIGGGIAGCSTAYALAQRGLKVTLFEHHPTIAAEASGNALAMLYPRLSGDNPLSQFSLAGFWYTLQWLEELNLPQTDFNACGLLQLGFNTRESARIEKVAQQNIVNVEHVSAHRASELAGIKLDDDALYFAKAGWVKPTALCNRLIAHQNISTITLSSVDYILNHNEFIEVIVDANQSFCADIAVICNGNDAHLFSQCSHINTEAVRGQITLCSATNESQPLKTIVCGEGYLSPAVENMHSLGATFSKEHTDLEVNQKDHDANLAMLKTIARPLQSALLVNGGRAALRCSTPDYYPLVGQLLDATKLLTESIRPNAPTHSLPWLNGMYMNVAHGSRGFTSAPLCAELLACLICGEALPMQETLAGLLNPNRFLLRQKGLKKLSKQIASS